MRVRPAWRLALGRLYVPRGWGPGPGQPELDQLPLGRWLGAEPLGRGHWRVVIQGLVGAVSVVLLDPGIDRGLGLLRRAEPAVVNEQLTAQRLVKRSILPVMVGDAGAVGDAVLAADLVEQHLPPLPKRSVNCLPLSVKISSGTGSGEFEAELASVHRGR